MGYKWISIFAAIVLMLGLSVCKTKTPEQVFTYLNHDTAVHYVGMESCKSCHLDKYSTFIQTGMGQSFDSAMTYKSSAQFNNIQPVYDAFKDFYYLPYFKQGILYIKEYRLQGVDTTYSRTERISYIIGSGHHTNSHMIMDQGFLFQAPLTFYTQKQTWDLPPGFENGNNSRFNRKIGIECMSCHNALPTLAVGSENQYTSLPHGISCERCHGPGELHVKSMQAGQIVDVTKGTDFSIVNPKKLSWARQIDLCQRCHLQGNAVLKPNKTFADFRPGMVLSETFDQFSPEYTDGEDFVMAAHAERFQQSKCFIAGASANNQMPKFTCISCHDPHVSVRATNTLKFNATCQQCHADKSCKAPTKQITANNNNCIKCHMPSTGTSDIPHVTVHDHYIRKPMPYKAPSKLKGLRCITSDKVDQTTLTEAYASYYEKFDNNPLYIQKAQSLSSELQTNKPYDFATIVHVYFLLNKYADIIQLVDKHSTLQTDAWTSYRIAKAYENTNQTQKALTYYEHAIELMPKQLDFRLQALGFMIKQEAWQMMETSVNDYLNLYDKTAEVHAYKGVLLMRKNALSEAQSAFNKALSLDPDLLLALQNLKQLYGLMGNTALEKSIELRIQTYKKRIGITK